MNDVSDPAALPVSNPLPPSAGIGLKPQHFAKMLGDEEAQANPGVGGVNHHPKPGWVEIHPQNYFVEGGPMLRWLEAIADVMPVSYHSTGLSLGSAAGPNPRDLAALKRLADRIEPASISDHLSWSDNAHEHFPDLLPVPYTRAALEVFVRNISQVQDTLGRAILIENPSRYLAFADDEMDELEFLHCACEMTGCGLLFDINNVVVSATNLDLDPASFIDGIDPRLVGEIHLAGHTREDHGDFIMAIDDHGSEVSDITWACFERFVRRSGPRPTLIEWDTDTPGYSVLMREAEQANAVLSEAGHAVAA